MQMSLAIRFVQFRSRLDLIGFGFGILKSCGGKKMQKSSLVISKINADFVQLICTL